MRPSQGRRSLGGMGEGQDLDRRAGVVVGLAGEEPAPISLGPRFDAALTLAGELHHDQVRKGSGTPYVAHLLAVASLVVENGGSEDAAIASLLHDAIEDQGGLPTLTRIVNLFGPGVGAIVEACSDSTVQPKPPALERKRRYIEHLDQDTTSTDVLLVSSADKLHNLRSILTDYRTVGPAVWDRFKLGPSDQLWYYQSLADIYRRRLGGPLSTELDRLVAELAGVVSPLSALVWARVAVMADCAVAAIGDPEAVDAPADRDRDRRGWIQLMAESGLGMVCGFAETDGLPVEIGIAGSSVIAARLEFVDDVADLEAAGEGAWEDLRLIRCDRVVATDLKSPNRPACRVELPLAAGVYRAVVFRTSTGDAVGIMLKAG